MKTPSNTGKKYTKRLKNPTTIAKRKELGAILQTEFDNQKQLNSLSKNDIAKTLNVGSSFILTTIFSGNKGYEITSFLAVAESLGFDIKLEKRNGR